VDPPFFFFPLDGLAISAVPFPVLAKVFFLLFSPLKTEREDFLSLPSDMSFCPTMSQTPSSLSFFASIGAEVGGP